MSTFKHLTEDDRAFIASSLDACISFKKIANTLCKNPSTIAKEVKQNRIETLSDTLFAGLANICAHRLNCSRINICYANSTFNHCRRLCSKCSKCNSLCKHFEEITCATKITAPFVCNGCAKKRTCRLPKYFYRATTAHKQYISRLSTSRQGINLSYEDCINLDNFITL